MNHTRLALGLLLAAAISFAADPALLNLLMKDPVMVAGIDMERARNSPFGQKILAEMKDEEPELQKLIAATGFDPRRDLREVVLASSGPRGKGTTIVAVRGSFDTARIVKWMQEKGAKSSSYAGVDLIQTDKGKHHDSVIAFLDPSFAMVGDEPAIKEAIDRRAAGSKGLDAGIAARVDAWSSKNDAWFVSGLGLNEMGVGAPGSNNRVLPGGVQMDAVRQASAGVRFGSVIEISGEALARSDKDAQALGDVLRFIAGMIRLNAKPGMEDALKIADSLQVATEGATMRFSISVPEEQLEKLLDQKRERKGRVREVRHDREVI